MERARVLWIEDRAFDAYARLAAPVFLSGKFSLQVALDATEGERQLREGLFSAVVVDIRLSPGDGTRWLDDYRRQGRNKVAAKLGLRLLERFLGTEGQSSPEWVRPEVFGVLSVETRIELASELDRLGVRYYREKRLADSLVLLELLEEIRNGGAGTA